MNTAGASSDRSSSASPLRMRLTQADLVDGGWLQSVDAWFAPRVDNPVLAQQPLGMHQHIDVLRRSARAVWVS